MLPGGSLQPAICSGPFNARVVEHFNGETQEHIPRLKLG